MLKENSLILSARRRRISLIPAKTTPQNHTKAALLSELSAGSAKIQTPQGRIGIFLKGTLTVVLLMYIWMLTGCAGKTTKADATIPETPEPFKEAVPESSFIQTVVSEILGKQPEDIKPEDLTRITCLEFSEKEDLEIDGICEIRFFLDGEAPAAKDYWGEIDRIGIDEWDERNSYKTSGKIELVYDDFEKDEHELSDLALFSSLKTLKLDIRLSEGETDLSPLSDLCTLSSSSYSVHELGQMFSETPKITQLTLYKLDSMEGITYFENLEYLAIDSPHVDNLEGIEQLTKLESFHISGITFLSIKGLELLSKTGHIENISFDKIGSKDLSFLKDIKQLKKLSLKNYEHTNLDFLEGLLELEQLDLDKCNELQDISAISDLTALTELRFTQNIGMALPDFTELTNLKRLDMTLCAPFDLDNLAHLTDLEFLVVFSNELYSPNSLKNMSQLKKLYLNYLYGDEDVSHLFNLQSLELLDLNLGTFRLNTDNLVPNHAMQHIYLSKSVINDGQTDFSFLTNYPNLINLNLNGQQVSSLDFLDSLTKLEGFCIAPEIWETMGAGKDREGLKISTLQY